MKTQTDNSIKDQNATCDNAVLSSRLFKFRAWNIPNKLMYKDVQNGLLAENEKGQLIIGLSLGKLSKDIGSVVMQFTGLKDKTGTEIYEGDILSERWKCKVYVSDEGTFMVKFYTNPKMNKPMTLKKYLSHREKAGTSDVDCKIIGNIFETPELL